MSFYVIMHKLAFAVLKYSNLPEFQLLMFFFTIKILSYVTSLKKKYLLAFRNMYFD